MGAEDEFEGFVGRPGCAVADRAEGAVLVDGADFVEVVFVVAGLRVSAVYCGWLVA